MSNFSCSVHAQIETPLSDVRAALGDWVIERFGGSRSVAVRAGREPWVSFYASFLTRSERARRESAQAMAEFLSKAAAAALSVEIADVYGFEVVLWQGGRVIDSLEGSVEGGLEPKWDRLANWPGYQPGGAERCAAAWVNFDYEEPLAEALGLPPDALGDWGAILSSANIESFGLARWF